MNSYTKLSFDFPDGSPGFLRDIVRHALGEAEGGRLRCLPLPQEGMGKARRGMQTHPFPELFLQMRGINRFRFPQGGLDLQPGDLTVVPPWLPHGEVTVIPEQDFLMLVVTPYVEGCSAHFSCTREERSTHRPLYREYFFSSHGLRMQNLCREFTSAVSLPPEEARRVAGGIALAVLGYIDFLLRYGVTQDGSHLVAAAQHYLGRNLADRELTVRQIARALKCNPDYLSNLFHRLTGERLTAQIRRLRLAQSRDLMLNSNLNIAEIARLCGFRTPNYFSRVFSEAHGVSPAQYRRDRTASGPRFRRDDRASGV